MYFLVHPEGRINDERMAEHCLKSGCTWLHIPSDPEIFLSPRDIPWDISQAFRNLLFVGDVQPSIFRPSAAYGYNSKLETLGTCVAPCKALNTIGNIV